MSSCLLVTLSLEPDVKVILSIWCMILYVSIRLPLLLLLSSSVVRLSLEIGSEYGRSFRLGMNLE